MIGRLTAGIRAQGAFLVLLAVAAVGAWLYVQFRQVEADRDRLAHEADVICASGGADFAASIEKTKDTKGKAVTIAHARGAVCRRVISNLADFRTKTDQETARILAEAMVAHDARQNTDTLAARDAAEAARMAAIRMETADAEAERRNIVDREWFAAVNGVAGLRAPDRITPR